MAAPFLPQASPRFPGNADLSNPLLRLGETIGGAIAQRRERNQLQELGQAAQGGDFEALRDAAFAQGRLGVGLNAQNTLDSRAARDSAAARADRSFGLQREEFEFNKKMKEAEFGLKKLEAYIVDQGGFKNTKERAEVEEGLRKEYTAISKDFRVVRDAYSRVQAATQNVTDANSGPADLALLFAYMKILDPGSVVRETEFANAENAQGVPDKVRSQYNKVLSGGRLTAQSRAEFVQRAKLLFEAQARQHDSLTTNFTDISSRLNLDPRNVVIDFSQAPAPAASSGVAPVLTTPSGIKFRLVE